MINPTPDSEISLSFENQRAVVSLFRRVDPYVLANRLGAVCLAPADLDLRSGQLVQPDLFVGGLIDGREPIDWAEFSIPILVAEVLSPSTARYDRVTKRRRYQRSGIPTYWIIDLDARVVEVWSPSDQKPAIADATLRWAPPGTDTALAIDLPTYFREVCGG